MTMPIQDLGITEQQLSEIVGETVENVFTTMFKQSLSELKQNAAPDPKNAVVVRVKLNHGSRDMDFFFAFDMQLLLQAATAIFSPDYIKNNPVHEDLACEIANIICGKVKAYLQEEGFHTDMSFPFIPKGEEGGAQSHDKLVQMHFFYRDKDTQKIGVAVDCFVV